jgi:hypothetical protein
MPNKLSAEYNFRPDNTLKCSKCLEIKPMEEFYTEVKQINNSRKGKRGWCKKCDSKHKLLRYSMDPNKFKRSATQSKRKAKKDCLDHYGHECACCKNTDEILLTIDHVFNDGHLSRPFINGKRSTSTSGWISARKRGFPDDLQILCMNCNYGKHQNGGVLAERWKKEKVLLPLELYIKNHKEAIDAINNLTEVTV